MKIIGLTEQKSAFIDTFSKQEFNELIKDENFYFDFVVNLENGKLLKNPYDFIIDDENILAYYGDFRDKDDRYILQMSYPSKSNTYPGIIISRKVFGITVNEISKVGIIRYIPECIFRSHT